MFWNGEKRISTQKDKILQKSFQKVAKTHGQIATRCPYISRGT